MRALLLAGGLGTRLRPLTLTRPKHLLPVANRPHIEHVFDLVRRHGVDEVVLTTSYLADTFADIVARAEGQGLAVSVAHEKDPLGTAGALKNAEPALHGEAFLVFNGDVLTDVDLDALVAFHRSKAAAATILLTPVDDPSAYGVVPTDEDGRVLAFVEKPPPGEAPSNEINAGVYVLEPEVLERVPAGEPYSTERQLFPQLVAEGVPVFAAALDAYWLDIGTPQSYRQANLDALQGRFRTSAVPTPGPNAMAIDDGAKVDPNADIQASCVGSGAVVAGGAVVHGSVLLPHAIAEPGAKVRRSVLGEGARVPSGLSVEDAVLADGEVAEG